MGLDQNSNVSPRTTPTREDLKSMIKDVVGELRAELIDEKRQKDLKTLDDPQKLDALKQAQAKKENEGFFAEDRPRGNVRRRFFDDIRDKDPEEMTRLERARMFARYVQCMFQAREQGGGIGLAHDLAKRCGQPTLAKAFQATDFNQGGFMVPTEYSSAIIEELTARAVYMRAGPQELDLGEGGLTLPYEDDGADASWTGEGVVVNAEEITGGQIVMQPKELITIVAMSNRLLRSQPGRSDTFVLNSMMRGMRTKLDSTLLRGQGVSNEPIGLAGLVPSANQVNVTSITGITMAVLVRELLQPQNLVETANIDLTAENPCYFGAPRTKYFLKAQRATDGLLFPGLETGNDLLGAPLEVTSNIPINLDDTGTAANDESELYFVAMGLMILGVTQDMQVDVVPNVSYVNSSGTTVSGLSRNETPIRIIGEYDHAASQRGSEIVQLKQIDWALV